MPNLEKQPILSNNEANYLKQVIEPFKNDIEYIMKKDIEDNDCYTIAICYNNGIAKSFINLPYFDDDTMYSNMEPGQHYTLEDLGIERRHEMDSDVATQTNKLIDMLEALDINIPRFRGLDLMSNIPKQTPEELKMEIEDTINFMAPSEVERLACSNYPWTLHPRYVEYNSKIAEKVKKYSDGKHINWDKIHGKKRKNARYVIKKMAKRVKEAKATQNKYAGRADVLRVYARIGSESWAMYTDYDHIFKHKAFLEKVDDWFDPSYCDIYLKIDKNML